jgi:hypothetical protein
MSELDKAREAAIKFHETYERLAPEFGYETRPDTKAFDPESANGKLMIAVCGEVLATATAKIEALEAKLAAAERLINEINDARAANWHLQRRRENDQFE